MITIEVTFSDGNILVTRINTDIQGAKAYYMGKYFTFMNPDEFERQVKATDVKQVN